MVNLRRISPVALFLAFALFLGVGAPKLATAAGLAKGHAVALSPDGTRLIAGGSNRALYELDPATLEVKKRVYLGRQIMQVAWSKDGTRIIVESTKVIQWLDSTSFEVLETRKDLQRMAPVVGQNKLVAYARGREGALLVLDLTSRAELARVLVEPRKSLAGFSLSPDGTKIAVLYARATLETEKAVGRRDIPKELKDAARNEFQQKNDGYGARYVIYNVADGTKILDKVLWYAAPGGANRLVWQGTNVAVVGYENKNALIDAAGAATYFELGNSYNYGHGASEDGAVIWSGGLGKGSVTPAGKPRVTFKLPGPDGFPEYFKSFHVLSDGSAYAGTTAFRVARLDAKGAVVVVAPIY